MRISDWSSDVCSSDLATQREIDPETAVLGDARQAFWTEFLPFLKLDDPEQIIPRAPRQGYIGLMLPAPGGSSWITVYRDMRNNEVEIGRASGRERVCQYV